MGHILQGLGTAALDTFGGLVTFAQPSDLPEGSSPRTWDTDYLTGSVLQRAGLASVFTFTNVLNITAVSIVYDLATFTFSATTKPPLINEAFLLSNFTGALSFLNGITVVVESAGINYFTAFVAHSDLTTTVATGSAASTTGDFVGPNLGGSAIGPTWTNPTGILGNITYASVISGMASTAGPTIPGAAANTTSSNQWSNPANILATSSAVTSVTLVAPPTGSVAPGIDSLAILANSIGYALPSDATVVGLQVSYKASSTAPAGKASINVQLAQNGNPIGTPVNQPISSTLTAYPQGSSMYQWGTTLTTGIVNGTPLGILVSASLLDGAGTATFSVNNLNVTVYYTTASSSGVLAVTVFAFAVVATSGISGIGITFEAYSSEATEITAQLLKDGIAVGTPKPLILTTTPTIYTLGDPNDMWGSTWLYSDANNTQFGVQLIASGTGTTFVRDLDMLVYVTPGLSNFNYIKSFVQDNGTIQALALDASGVMWKEDTTNNPGVLSIVESGFFPGTFAKSQTAQDREYICFSKGTFFSVAPNQTVTPVANPYGGFSPLTWDGSSFNPLSMVGPGAAPSFVGATGTSQSGTQLTITSWAISGNVLTFTFNAGPTVTAGQVYNVSGAVPAFLNVVGVVLGTPPPTGTTFAVALTHADASGSFSPSAKGVLQFNYPITSITQNAQHALAPDSGGHGLQFWGAGPGPTHSPGSNFVVYYGETEDTVLTKYFAAHPNSTYVYLSNLNNFPQFVGTYLITAVGNAKPSGTAGASRFYFVVNVGTQGQAYPDGSTGDYQLTIATVTTQSAVAGLQSGNSVQITGETPIAWNNQWSIVEALTSSSVNVTSTQMSSTGVATYDFSLPAGGVSPANGQIASITGCNNSGAGYTVSPFNTVGVIVYPGSDGASSFDIHGFTSGLPLAPAVENGTAITYGTQFSIDPGLLSLGGSTNPIYGNAGAAGNLYIVGSSTATPIAAGTRQAVVYFITDTGLETAPSPPIVFTVPTNTTAINYSNLPIGPPNVVARGIAITEAGQNGIPGANFYTIPNPVTVPTLNGAPLVYGPTIIRDNTTTSGVITFTDAILLASTEIDIQGNNLFNLIELGSPAWCVSYASRMFYGLCLNKVDNFDNMTFDGGYNPTSTGTSLVPLGWQVVNPNDKTFTLINSPIAGMSLYYSNKTGSTVVNAGVLYQSAYQDVYGVPILNINTTYSVRVVCRNPSGISNGSSLFFNLGDFIPNIGFTTNWGNFVVPFSAMSTVMQEFTGTILTTPFSTTGVSTHVVFSVQAFNLAPGADCEIARIDVFPTEQPYLTTKVFGSYVNNLEAVDASGDGGIIDTSVQNNQPCTGGFVLHDNLYLLKTESMYSTQDTPTSEPGGWELHEVSNKVGSVGIFSYDVGEEWAVTACRSGIFGFNGGQPVKFMQEIWQVWDKINWDAGASIVLRNDIVNRRILCAVPLPTPNKWMPDSDVVVPTSPNVILMCNYQGLNTFEDLMNSPQIHVTMFGTLASPDMKRKWSIWRIKTPYMDFVTRQDGIDKPLLVCNGINSEKIYEFSDTQYSDDGVAIYALYTTYGFVNAEKAATVPIFGYHAKRYTILQVTAEGAGNLTIRALPNTLEAKYPLTLTGASTPGVPGTITLSSPVMDDYYRNLNVKGNRMYLEFSTNAVGSWFNVSKAMLSGVADPHSALNPTGGGNVGIV